MVADTDLTSKVSAEVSATRLLSDDDKRAATTLFDLIGSEQPVDASQYIGSGFTIVEDKDRLKGVPFWVTDVAFNKGDIGEFASLEVVTGPDRNGVGTITGKYVINDGGTGIAEQVRQLMTNLKGELGPFYVGKGLRRSDYTAGIGRDGKERPAGTTYYLDIPGQSDPA